MLTYPRPLICASTCLETEAVRYNGQILASRIIRDIRPYADIIPVCPEVGIGLGVPRPSLRIVREDGEDRLIQPETQKDLTGAMKEFCREFLIKLEEVDGFILTERSPTMGKQKIKVYSGHTKAPVIDTCGGFFYQEIMRQYPGLPVEENKRLLNRKIRHYFLLRLFLIASFREHKKTHTLTEFHAANRLLIMKHDHSLFLSLDETDPDSTEYESLLKRIIAHQPTPKTIREFLMAMAPKTIHREEFESMIEAYTNNYVSSETCLEVLRFELLGSGYEDQTIFCPYPEPLKEGAEPDFTRDYWN